MDNRGWKNLLLSWANILHICDQEINSIDDLVTSDFFPRLACKLLGQQKQRIRNIEGTFHFLKDLYPSIDIDSNQLNESDIVAAATLFLVHCSLNQIPRDPELQEKVCSLPHNQQCLLKALLERFITTEKSSITKARIFSEISSIGGESNSSCTASPANVSQSTPLSSISHLKLDTSSNSSKRSSRVRRLRSQIENLTSLQIELQEELDVANQKIAKLSDTVISKDNEIARLKSEIASINQSNDNSITSGESTYYREHCIKCTDLTDRVQSLEREYAELQDELVDTTTKSEIKCASLQEEIITFDIKLKQSVESEELLKDEIIKLNSIICELRATNQEQLEYLDELKRKPNDISESSLPDLLLPEENLGSQVIDLQLQELRQSVEEREKQITGLYDEIDSLKSDLKISQTIILEHTNTIKMVSEQKEVMVKQVEELENNLFMKESNIKQLEEEKNNFQNNLEQVQEELNKIMADLTNTNALKDKLSADLNTNIKQLEILFQEKESFINELDIKNTKIFELLNTLKESDELKISLENKIEAQISSLEALCQEKERLIEGIDSLTRNNNSLMEKIIYLEREVSNRYVAMEKMIKEKEELMEKLKALEKYNSTVSKENGKIIEENKTLIGQVNDYMICFDDNLREKEEFKEQICNQDINLQKFLREKNDLLKQLSLLENEMISKNNEIISYQESVNLLTNENLKLNGEVGQLRKALVDKSSFIEIKLVELEAVRAELEKLTNDNNNKETLLQRFLSKEKVFQQCLLKIKDKIHDVQKFQENIQMKCNETISEDVGEEGEAPDETVYFESYQDDSILTEEETITGLNPFTKEFDALMEKLELYKNSVKEYSYRLESSERIIASLNNEKGTLQEKVEITQNNLEKMLKGFNEKLANEKCLISKNGKLAERVLHLEKEKLDLLNNALVSNKRIDALTIKSEKLEILLQEKDEIIENYKKENENLLHKISLTEAKIYENEKDISNNVRKISVLECDIERLHSKVNSLQNQVFEKMSEISFLTKDNTYLKNKCTFLETDHKELLLSTNKKEELIKDLESEKDVLTKKIKFLEDEMEKLICLKSEKEAERKTLVNNNAKLLGDIVLLKVDLDLSKKTLISITEDKNTLVQMLDDVKNELSNMTCSNQKNTILSDQIEHLNVEIKSLQNANEKHSETLLYLTEQKDTLEEVIEMLKYDLVDRMKEWDKNQKSEDEQFQMKIYQELNSLRLSLSDKENEIISIYDTVEKNDKLFVEVSDQLRESKKYINELENKNKELSNDVNLMKDELTKMTEREENLKANIKTLNIELFLKNRDIRAKSSELRLLKEDKTKLQDELSVLRTDIEALQKTRDFINETNNSLVEELEKAKKYLTERLREENITLVENTTDGNTSENLDDKDLTLNVIIEQFKFSFDKLKNELAENRKKITDLEANMSNVPVLKVNHEKEVKTLSQSFQDYKRKTQEEIDSLRKDYHTVKEKYLNAKIMISDMETNTNDLGKNIRAEYEQKLNKLKIKMKQTYKEKLEDLTFSTPSDTVKKLKEELRYERGKAMGLESRLLEYSDKLLIAQEENRRLLSENFVKPAPPAFSSACSLNQAHLKSTPIMKAHSAEILTGRNNGIDNLGHDLSPSDSFNSDRRSSVRSLPRGIGRVFPAAEEAGEVFDDRCLSDLKAGIVNLSECDPRQERMSILQLRNSLCPPHLKSSYPVETQFLNPGDLREEDIKSGTGNTVKGEPSEDKNVEDKRKFKIQISYKKPSPPSTSKTSLLKVGGILKEQNRNQQKLSTPSRIKALFGCKPKDENSPVSRTRSHRR